jgi:LuxR family quorum-sensing system transcriptional regulator CciR
MMIYVLRHRPSKSPHGPIAVLEGARSPLRALTAPLARANDLPSLITSFGRVARCLGFSHYVISRLSRAQCASCSEAALEMICAHYPDQWVQHYQKNGYALVDPVHRTAFTQTAPYRWRDIANLNRLEQRVLDEALEAGLANGISIPIHEPTGRVLLVNLSGQASVVNAEATRRLAHLISTQFHYEFERLGKHQSAAVSQRLTPRQCECLTWVARGKSSWTIGQLLGISQHTVDYHIDTAMEALNVNSRTSAAVKAAVLGLIRP